MTNESIMNKRIERIARSVASKIEMDMEYRGTTKESFIKTAFDMHYSSACTTMRYSACANNFDGAKYNKAVYERVQQILRDWKSVDDIDEVIKFSKKN